MNFKDSITYDAIVVGSGISGGWAAKELTERGLKTLMLERGRDVKHVVDYTTAMKDPWDFPHRGRISLTNPEEDAVRVNKLAINEPKHKYVEERSFRWARAYGAGGRSLLWGRQTYRLNEEDFLANAIEGIGVDWPIRYQDRS